MSRVVLKQPTPLVFIISAPEDGVLTAQLVAKLRALGIEARCDRSVPTGQNRLETVAGWLERATLVPVLLTESSVRSPRVKKQLWFAEENGRFRLPIRIGDVDLPSELHFSLGPIKIAEFPAGVDATALAQCIRRHHEAECISGHYAAQLSRSTVDPRAPPEHLGE